MPESAFQSFAVCSLNMCTFAAGCTGCYLAGRYRFQCQWKETGGELLKYKLPFFWTMRQPLKNLCRLEICQLYQFEITPLLLFATSCLGMLSGSARRSVFIDEIQTLLCPALHMWPILDTIAI